MGGPNTHILHILAMPEMSTPAAAYNSVQLKYSSGRLHVIATGTRKKQAKLKSAWAQKKINSRVFCCKDKSILPS